MHPAFCTLILCLLESCTAHQNYRHHQHHARAAVAASAPTPVPVPNTVPSDASPPIDPSFAAFAFEETSFYLYAGPPGQPNQFSVNLMNAIASRTSTRPVLRVGGTSLDRAVYNRNQKAAVNYPAGQSGNVPSGVTIGPRYFNSFPNFPNARYILDIPLATNNLDNSVAFATDAYKVIKPQLYGLEIGNEPGFYPGTVRASSYSVQDYIRQFTQYSNAVNAALGISSNTPIYEALGLGAPPAYETSDNPGMPGAFYPNNAFNAGLKNIASRFMSTSLHYYQTQGRGASTPQLMNELLNHTITTRKTDFFKPAIQYFRQYYPNKPVNLAEVASSLNGNGNDYGLEQVFGAALWQVDWMLYCASIGINRVNWQQISGSAFDLWQPVAAKGRQPAVLPPFYAMVFVADFISQSGGVRIKNINLNRDKLTAYAAYGPGGSINRVALINMQFFSGVESASNPRTVTYFQLTPPADQTAVLVRKLSSNTGATASAGSDGGSDETNGITWNQQHWSYESNGIAQTTKMDTVTLPIVNGKVLIPVRASEAVMVSHP